MQLFLHKDVEDYFEVMETTDLDAASGRKAAIAYEDAKAILMKGLKPEFDPDFFATVHWPKIDGLKKLKGAQLVTHHDKVVGGALPLHDTKAAANSPASQYSKLLMDVFHGDHGRLAAFIENVRSINRFMQATIHSVFPNYRFVRELNTWRCSETINENLHFDIYRQYLPDHHARLFINLDNIPRIWHTSHRLEWVLERHLHLLPREFLINATPGRICWDLNYKVFGDRDVAGREGAPKHICFFEPGDVWLVDSRKISHQIFYGRCAVSTEFQVDTASMIDPAKHYYNIVEQHRTRFLESTA